MFATAVKQELSLSEEKDKPRAILVEFMNGNLSSRGKKDLTFTCYKNGKTTSSFPERILVSKSKAMCYVGSNFENRTSKITSSVMKIFVVNNKKSSSELYDVDYFQLRPHLKSPEIIETKVKSYIEKSSDLALTFGSKSQQKTINTSKRYGDYAEITDPLTISRIAEASESSNSSLPAESQTPSAIPPQNSSAVSVEEVYNLYDIISLEELDALTSESQVFLDATQETIQQWNRENKYSSFIIQFLESNVYSMNSDKAKLLCYLHYMFCFLRTAYSDWKKKAKGVIISKKDCPETSDELTEMETIPFRSLLGSLAFIASRNRPDISFAVNVFSQVQENPGRKHCELLLRLLGYVMSTKDLRLDLTCGTTLHGTTVSTMSCKLGGHHFNPAQK